MGADPWMSTNGDQLALWSNVARDGVGKGWYQTSSVNRNLWVRLIAGFGFG
jgi:hypothetical protein